MYFILRELDTDTNKIERVEILFSNISKDLMKSLIEDFTKIRFDKEKYIINPYEGFVDFLHEKGIGGKLLRSEDITLIKYESL